MAVQSLKCPCLLNGRFSHPLKWQTSSVWAKTMLYVQVRGSTSGAQIKLTHSKWHESMCLSLLTHDQYELMRWQEPTLLWWWGSECVERSRMLNARRGRGVNKKTRTIHPSTSKHPLTCSSLVGTHTHTHTHSSLSTGSLLQCSPHTECLVALLCSGVECEFGHLTCANSETTAYKYTDTEVYCQSTGCKLHTRVRMVGVLCYNDL